MADSKDQLQANTYIWSQSDDQVTISFLVPETCKTKDLEVRFEHQHVCAGLKGQEPVLKVNGDMETPLHGSNERECVCLGQVVFAYQPFWVVVAAWKDIHVAFIIHDHVSFFVDSLFLCSHVFT